MGRVKTLIVSVALIFGVMFLSVFSHTTDSWAYDQCYYIYEALLDTDNNESTGSNGDEVRVVQGAETPHAIHGIDYIVRVEADICGTAGEELGPIQVLRWNNNDSKFGLETSYPSLYHLGFENSDIITNPSPLHHADVIEFRAFKSDIGSPQGRIKVIYHASRAGSSGNDYTDPLYDPPLSIPTLSQWGIIVLSLLLGIFAFFIMKKQKKASLKLLCVAIVFISMSGIAWAFCVDIICLDGGVNDWNNLSTPPLSITDPSEDSSANDMGEDILKGYVTSDDTHYFFRIDVAGGPFPG